MGAGQSPLDNGLEYGLQSAAYLGQAVFDFRRHNVVLPAVNQPSMLQFLQFATQDTRCHGFAECAFEQGFSDLAIPVGPLKQDPQNSQLVFAADDLTEAQCWTHLQFRWCLFACHYLLLKKAQTRLGCSRLRELTVSFLSILANPYLQYYLVRRSKQGCL